MDKRFLILTASPLEQDSVSFRMADVCERAIREAKPGAELIRRDLNQLALPPMTRELIDHFNLGKSSLDQAIIEVIDELHDEFMAADRYIFAMPHWNLCVPPAMLNYSLCTMRAGSAFKYTEAGPVGLLKNKRALILLASGGSVKRMIRSCAVTVWIGSKEFWDFAVCPRWMLFMLRAWKPVRIRPKPSSNRL